jgi:hypothetical protein
MADGRPDLSGHWQAGGGGGGAFAAGGEGAQAGPNPDDLVQNVNLRNGDMANLTNDGVPARRAGNNLPIYKPEHWDRVLDLDWNGNLEDPFNHCMPMGVPRMGPPTRIVHTPGELFFFYTVPFQKNDFRMVPIGDRKHPVDPDGTWHGDPVARWEGDTLIIDTIGFTDRSWFGPEGYFHGYDMKVTERFTPDGDGLIYDVTVEDPEVLEEPWVMTTRRLRKIVNPMFRMTESAPCSERNAKNMVGKQREM